MIKQKIWIKFNRDHSRKTNRIQSDPLLRIISVTELNLKITIVFCSVVVTAGFSWKKACMSRESEYSKWTSPETKLEKSVLPVSHGCVDAVHINAQVSTHTTRIMGFCLFLTWSYQLMQYFILFSMACCYWVLETTGCRRTNLMTFPDR